MCLSPSVRLQKARGLFVSILLGKAPVSSVTRKPLGDLLVVTTEETGALLLSQDLHRQECQCQQ